MRQVVGPILLATLYVLVLGACGAGGGTAQNKEAARDSPVSSEPGWLAYQADPGDLLSIKVHLVRTDGSQDHQIADQLPGAVRHPDFSPDGARLAFDQLTSEEHATQTYVAKADGSGAKIVARCERPGCSDLWEPAFSPDGERLAVSTGSGPITETGPERFGLAIVDVDSGELTPVLDHESEEGQDRFARWSPDGERLAFYRVRVLGDGEYQTAVFVVNVDGSGLRQITPWKMLAGDPDWSPEGDLIVFSTRPSREYPTGRSELYTIRPDGAGMRRLTDNGEDGPRATEPRWTPDGEAILYVRSNPSGTKRHVWAMDPTEGADAPVLTKASAYTHPVLQPRGAAGE